MTNVQKYAFDKLSHFLIFLLYVFSTNYISIDRNSQYIYQCHSQNPKCIVKYCPHPDIYILMIEIHLASLVDFNDLMLSMFQRIEILIVRKSTIEGTLSLAATLKSHPFILDAHISFTMLPGCTFWSHIRNLILNEVEY